MLSIKFQLKEVSIKLKHIIIIKYTIDHINVAFLEKLLVAYNMIPNTYTLKMVCKSIAPSQGFPLSKIFKLVKE